MKPVQVKQLLVCERAHSSIYFKCLTCQIEQVVSPSRVKELITGEHEDHWTWVRLTNIPMLAKDYNRLAEEMNDDTDG